MEIFEINREDILNLLYYKEDKQKILGDDIFLLDENLKQLYQYFCVNNYDELYNKLEKRIEIKKQINKYNLIHINGYIFDEKDYSFINNYYKKLSDEEKNKMAKKYNTTVSFLSKKFKKIENGYINEEIFIGLLDEYNVSKLSELKIMFEKLNLENRKQRIIERNYADKKENNNIIENTIIETKPEEIINDEHINLIIDYVNNYLKTTNMSINEFAKRLKMKKPDIISYLNKNNQSKFISEKILEYFNFVSINELKNRLKSLNKNNKQIIQKINVNQLNELMVDLLKQNQIQSIDYRIFWLLFKENKINYSKEEIAKFFNVELNKVLEVYNNCLSLYKKHLECLLKNKETVSIKLIFEKGDKNE